MDRTAVSSNASDSTADPILQTPATHAVVGPGPATVEPPPTTPSDDPAAKAVKRKSGWANWLKKQAGDKERNLEEWHEMRMARRRGCDWMIPLIEEHGMAPSISPPNAETYADGSKPAGSVKSWKETLVALGYNGGQATIRRLGGPGPGPGSDSGAKPKEKGVGKKKKGKPATDAKALESQAVAGEAVIPQPPTKKRKTQRSRKEDEGVSSAFDAAFPAVSFGESCQPVSSTSKTSRSTLAGSPKSSEASSSNLKRPAEPCISETNKKGRFTASTPATASGQGDFPPPTTPVLPAATEVPPTGASSSRVHVGVDSTLQQAPFNAQAESIAEDLATPKKKKNAIAARNGAPMGWAFVAGGPTDGSRLVSHVEADLPRAARRTRASRP